MEVLPAVLAQDRHLNLLLEALRVLLRHPSLICYKQKGIKINNRKFTLCRQCKREEEIFPKASKEILLQE